MTNRELEERLARAAGHAAPDNFEDVISRSRVGEGRVGFMAEKPKRKKKTALLGGLIAACLVLMAAGGGLYYYRTGVVAAVISLDVNPSIELKVNQNEKVISCTPLNADASLVLFDMGGGADLEGAKVDVAVNAIIGALVRHGYLDSVSSAILITVEDSNRERAARLQTELYDITNSVLQAQDSGANVISQTLAMDAGLERQAQQSNISSGRAALINQVIAVNDALSFDALAALSVEELQDLMEAGAPAMPIGRESACYAAEQYAGTLALDSVTAEADPELDETPAYYEVELHTHFGDFEYIIDAYTGDVLRGQADILGLAQNSAATPQPGDAGQAAPNSSGQGDAGQATPNPSGQGDAGQTAPNPSGQGDAGQATPNPPRQEGQGQAAPAPGQSGSPAAGEADYIGLERAKSAALTHAGVAESSTLYCNCRLDYDDGRPECYKVEFAVGDTEYEYEIGLYSDTILKHEAETYHTSHHGGFDSGVSSPAGTDIGQDAAKSAALTHAGLLESQVTDMKVERDYDDGRLEYEVEFRCNRMEYEYTVDGVTGDILEYDWDED